MKNNPEQEQFSNSQTTLSAMDEELLQEWLAERKYARRRLTLYFLCGCALCVILLYAVEIMESIFEIIALVSFLAMLVYWWALSYSNRKAMQQLCEENPDLLSPEVVKQMQEPRYRRSLDQKQLVVLLIGIVAMIFLRSFFMLIIAAVVAACMNRSDQSLQQAPVAVRLRETEKRHTQRLGCLWTLIPALAIGMIVVESMLGFVANARVNSINATAHSVYDAAVQWQYEQDENGLPSALETQIVDCSLPAEKGSFAAYLQDMTAIEEYCAVICDKDGNVQYALYAKIPITENQLTPMTLEEQRRIESSLFTRGQAVGCYRP